MILDIEGLNTKLREVSDIFLPYDIAEYYMEEILWGKWEAVYGKYRVTARRMSNTRLKIKFVGKRKNTNADLRKLMEEEE